MRTFTFTRVFLHLFILILQYRPRILLPPPPSSLPVSLLAPFFRERLPKHSVLRVAPL